VQLKHLAAHHSGEGSVAWGPAPWTGPGALDCSGSAQRRRRFGERALVAAKAEPSGGALQSGNGCGVRSGQAHSRRASKAGKAVRGVYCPTIQLYLGAISGEQSLGHAWHTGSAAT